MNDLIFSETISDSKCDKDIEERNSTKDCRPVIFTDWETYASQYRIELSAEQKQIMAALIAMLSDFETASFFRSRLTGVTYLLEHFELFCKSQK